MEKLKIRTKINIEIERNEREYAGTFISFEGIVDDEHFAIGFGDWEGNQNPLVRIHSECLTGDVFGSTRCDCGAQLSEAIDLASKEGGFVLYLRQEGRGIGLYNKFDAYHLQDKGFDTYAANTELGFGADIRDFTVAAEMLKALGKTEITLHSNNKRKRQKLEDEGIVVSPINTGVFENPNNRNYLLAKKEIGAHSLQIK